MNGSDGDDTFYAQDDEADATISGGAGVRHGLHRHRSRSDVRSRSSTCSETTRRRRRRVTGCTYDAVTKTAKATLAPGATATLVVAGDADPVRDAAGGLRRGNHHQHRLDSGHRRRRLGREHHASTSPAGRSPRARRPSPGSSEIEISLLLGDAADRLTIMGTAGPDTISVGTNGIAFTTDADVDVTSSPLPAVDRGLRPRRREHAHRVAAARARAATSRTS